MSLPININDLLSYPGPDRSVRLEQLRTGSCLNRTFYGERVIYSPN